MFPSHTCVIYAAFSAARNDTLDQQLTDCEAFAKREGLAVIGRFSEAGHSAFKGNRGPELERAMAAAEAAAPCSLIVRHSTRLARGDAKGQDGARSLIEVGTWAMRHNVTLRSVNDDHSFSNPILLAVADMLAHGESATKSARGKDGIRRRVESGKHPGGKVYGYRHVEGVLAPYEPEAAVVRRIYAMLAEGQTQNEVTASLNREFAATGSGGTLRGKNWSQGSLSGLIKNRTYLGEIPVPGTDREEWLPGKHAPIIDAAVWDAAHASVASRARRPGNGGGRPPVGNQLLSGWLLKHAACGYGMAPISYGNRDGSVTARYVCQGKRAGRCEHGLRVDASAVDAVIARFLADVGVDVDASLKAAQAAVDTATATHAAQVTHAAKLLKDSQASIARIRAEYLAGVIDGSEWKSLKADLEPRAAEAEATLETLSASEPPSADEIVGSTVTALEIVQSAIDAGDVAQVRQSLARLFERFDIERFAVEPDADPEFEASLAAEAGRNLGEIAANETGFDSGPTPEDLLVVGDYVLTPTPRQDALSGIVTTEGGRLLTQLRFPAVTSNEKACWTRSSTPQPKIRRRSTSPTLGLSTTIGSVWSTRTPRREACRMRETSSRPLRSNWARSLRSITTRSTTVVQSSCQAEPTVGAPTTSCPSAARLSERKARAARFGPVMRMLARSEVMSVRGLGSVLSTPSGWRDA